MPIVIRINCPDYVVGENLDLEKVSKCVAKVLQKNFQGKKIILRGIQSKKHATPKEQLIQKILDNGTDRNDLECADEAKVNDKPIDLFGYSCEIGTSLPNVLPLLEGFHKWKPKALERPQHQVDLWLVYEASQLKNVEYTHGLYGVKANDGYIFKEPQSKSEALLGIVVIE